MGTEIWLVPEIVYPNMGQMSLAKSREMSYGESRMLIQHGHEGRLAYLSGRGARSVVINYAITDDQILFLVPYYNEITQYVPGRQVTLLVDEETTAPVSRQHDTVSVKGIANLAGSKQASTIHRTTFLETWPPGVTTSIICLPISDIEGSSREVRQHSGAAETKLA